MLVSIRHPWIATMRPVSSDYLGNHPATTPGGSLGYQRVYACQRHGSNLLTTLQGVPSPPLGGPSHP